MITWFAGTRPVHPLDSVELPSPFLPRSRKGSHEPVQARNEQMYSQRLADTAMSKPELAGTSKTCPVA